MCVCTQVVHYNIVTLHTCHIHVCHDALQATEIIILIDPNCPPVSLTCFVCHLMMINMRYLVQFVTFQETNDPTVIDAIFLYHSVLCTASGVLVEVLSGTQYFACI